MPAPLAATAARLRDILAELDAAVAREAAFRALAEAVVTYDGDGLSDVHRPEWAALVTQARAVLAARS